MEIQPLLDEIKKIEHGFKHITEAGDTILSGQNLNHFDVAIQFLGDESYQVRMLGTYILGALSAGNTDALKILKTQVSQDQNWRVQEMLAKAFDRYCETIGYEKSLPVIELWLDDRNPNVKRAVIEGLRIWTGRPFFKTNPTLAIQLISRHKADPSEYLRKSVGNALRDIGKKHSDLIDCEIASWDLIDLKINFTYKLVIKG
ncbi:HEAT repeat domain-containing protein [Dyadobacter sp. CY312]|uniref:HEAT repeat domain-containing protein n=1 Tax=Dyadobacter sp. CY312 TaxID=2907303 RepID=UPI001F37A10C|nr:HEAT repeat domain-containing protein [Dyadobacter sp. CY312]MCE7044509.1 DNA alkylation repair protein [Dyadobacter sp. CY312]